MNRGTRRGLGAGAMPNREWGSPSTLCGGTPCRLDLDSELLTNRATTAKRTVVSYVLRAGDTAEGASEMLLARFSLFKLTARRSSSDAVGSHERRHRGRVGNANLATGRRTARTVRTCSDSPSREEGLALMRTQPAREAV
jgi:hypothetical protein